MVDARHREDWEQLAAVDPLWAVLSDPAKRGGRWSLEEFLATGVADAAALMTIARRLGHPVRNGSALDFGAGVGRVSRALAATFESVVGVDVSASMVEQAQTNCAGLPNASFVLAERGTLTRMEPASFDLVYSRWVLQHLPNETLVSETLRDLAHLVRPGGLLAVQVPGRIPVRHRLQPSRRAYALLDRLRVPARVLLGRLRLSPIRMTGITQADARRVLSAAGMVVLEVQADVIRGSSIDSFTYYATVAPGSGSPASNIAG